MDFKQTIHQIQPGREFGGKFVVGQNEFDYNLLFRVQSSQMDAEVEKRQANGHDISSIDTKRELFILTVKNRDGKNLDLSDDESYGLLLHLACDMAAEVSDHVLTEEFNELFGGVLQESFIEHRREFKIRVENLPESLRTLLLG